MPKQSLPPLPKWGRIYVAAIVAIGLAAIAHSIYVLYVTPIGWNWFVLAILTLISGSATVRLPSVPATISISETFVFTSVLLFGPAAGTLTVALDALAISLWLARRGHPFYRLIFNIGAVPAALWLAAHLFYFLSGLQPLSSTNASVNIGTLVKPLIVLTVVYFSLNSWLIAFAISIERRLSPLRVWKDNFALLSLNYFGGASAAALLVSYTRNIDIAYLAFVLPLIAILYVTFVMSMGRVEDANKHLSQLNTIYLSTIETLAMAIDAKDQITHGHIRRVQHYAIGLARELGVTETAQISAIEAASLLHDMGKLAVPEYILNKPGPLTPVEFEKMKLHASVGADILSAIDFPYPVVPIVRHHHESWDGSGYPDGLKGSDIPIGARILSVVDCFDALTSDRPYRPRLSDTEAVNILVQRRGSMYDPLIVDTFIAVHAKLAPSESPGAADSSGGLVAITTKPTPDSIGSGSGLDNIAASTEEAIVLHELTNSLTNQSDLEKGAETISQHLRRLVPAATVVLYVFDETSDEVVATHASGENAGHYVGLRIPRGQRLTGWVAANQHTIANSDPVLDLGEIARAMRPRPRSCLSTPLLSDSHLVGVLSLYAIDREAFTDDHKRIIELVARHVSHNVARLVPHETTRTRPVPPDGAELLDGLQSAVDAGLAMKSGSEPLSIVLVDVNQTTGRRGDRAQIGQTVSSLSDAAKKTLRSSDVVLTHGGSWFVVLLKQAGTDVAESVARRLTQQLVALNASRPPDGGVFSISVSVATAPADGITAQALLSTAQRRVQHRTPHEPGSTSVH